MKRIFLYLMCIGFSTCFAFTDNASNFNNFDYLNEAEGNVYEGSEPVGLGFFVEFLYWKTNIATFPFAFTTVAGDHSLSTDQKLQQVPFSYDPGFRVGANYEFTCDHWDAAIVYTRFKQSNSNAISKTETLNLKTVWDVTGLIQADSAAAKLHESFQTIDLVLGKTFRINCPFNIRYYAGIKWAHIKELMNILIAGRVDAGPDLTSQITDNTELKNFSKNIGLMGGVTACWDFKKGLGIYSRGELALLRSRFSIGQQEIIDGPSFTPPTVITLQNTQIFKAVKANLVLELGIQWCRNFCCDRIQLGLNIGYELNYWPTQILLARFVVGGDPASTTGPIFLTQQSTDLGFGGFNFGVSINF